MSKTSIKPMLNVRSNKPDECCALIIQVIRLRRRSVMFTGYRLYRNEFPSGRMTAVNRSRSRKRIEYIATVNSYLGKTMEELCRIVERLESGGVEFSAADVINVFREQADNGLISTFFRKHISEMHKIGHFGTAVAYSATFAAFERYYGGKKLRMEDIDTKMVLDFRKSLFREKLKVNTVSFYLGKFRALYNQAVKAGYVQGGRSPFSCVSLRMEPTRKLAVNDKILRAVAFSELPEKLNFARDLFMFSFYCRGMSFVDMSYLRQTDIHNGAIRYRRHKTGQLFTVHIIPELQVIIDRYSGMCRPFVLPIIVSRDAEGNPVPLEHDLGDSWTHEDYEKAAYDRYRYQRTFYLHRLRSVSRVLGLDVNLTFNMARHTWASRARRQGICMAVISESLGHTSEKTTRIYLDQMESRQIDDANRIVTSF